MQHENKYHMTLASDISLYIETMKENTSSTKRLPILKDLKSLESAGIPQENASIKIKIPMHVKNVSSHVDDIDTQATKEIYFDVTYDKDMNDGTVLHETPEVENTVLDNTVITTKNNIEYSIVHDNTEEKTTGHLCSDEQNSHANRERRKFYVSSSNNDIFTHQHVTIADSFERTFHFHECEESEEENYGVCSKKEMDFSISSSDNESDTGLDESEMSFASNNSEISHKDSDPCSDTIDYSSSSLNRDYSEPPDEDLNSWIREESSASEPSSSEEEMNFNSETLNVTLRSNDEKNAREALILNCAAGVKSNLQYETVVMFNRILNVLFKKHYMPSTKKLLWKSINKKPGGMTIHAYCDSCFMYLKKMKQLQDDEECPACGKQILRNNVKTFISLNLRKQFENFLKISGIGDVLFYKHRRVKKFVDSMEDVFDSKHYKHLVEQRVILPNDFIYAFNTDGFPLFESSNMSAWPLFVRLLDLPPHLRQKHMFLAGLWIDNKEPKMISFLKPFVQQANNLFRKGLVWTTDARTEIHSKFIPFCCSADSKARCTILNMNQYNAHYGCTICEHYGCYINGSMRYPLASHTELPKVNKRTHDSIVTDMKMAFELQQNIKGVCGPSQLMNLEGFDLVKGQSIDVLHAVWIGVTQRHTNQLLRNTGKEYYIKPDQKILINQRLKTIKTPSMLARRPRSLEQVAKWKASEWRNWLLFYAIPCLQGCILQKYINHFAMLSNAVFLLSQTEIKVQDFERARMLIRRYLVLYEKYFGKDQMVYNIHLCEHFSECIENLGPTWVHSTCGFESWNYKLRKMITSTKGIIKQIVTRFQLRMLITGQIHNIELSEDVRQELERILFKRDMTKALRIGDVFLFGKQKRRRPTTCEAQALREANLHFDKFTIFRKMVGLFGEIQPAGIGSSHSNNYLLLWQNKFCRVQEIIALEEPPVCGIFVKLLEIRNRVNFASHIAVLLRERGTVFVRSEEIRTLAFVIVIEGVVYITPISNLFEID